MTQAAIQFERTQREAEYMESIRLVTWLAPGIPLLFFEKVRETLEESLGVSVSLQSRTKLSGPTIGSPDPFADGDAELGFLCAPAAVPAQVRRQGGFELLELAPLFDDVRYAEKPRCFCDIVVRNDTAHSSLEDLRGKTFGYNDTTSLSGWLGLTTKLRTQQEDIQTFFGSLVHTGGHMASLDKLRDGSIQVASIDSNVIRTHPGSLRGLSVIDSVGPWPAQPVVIRSNLSPHLKEQIKHALTTCGPWEGCGFIGFRSQELDLLSQVPTAAISK
jgi:ABC-type phosphate/phosphonate transport system substrate-binding protein